MSGLNCILRIFFNELTLTSSYSADHLDTRKALKLLASGVVNGQALITNHFPLERLSEAILKTAGRESGLKNVIVFE